jgi:ankyrin repeat protein
MAAVAALALAATPAAAQQFSDSYEFLEAVRKVDGTKVNRFLEDKSLRIVNSKDRNTGEAALHIVAKRRDITYLRVLMNQPDINPNIQDRAGETPLLVAVSANWEDGVSRLARGGANVNLANARGETPLIRAVLLHNDRLVRMLLDAGADPDRADFQAGMSARDYARRESRYPVIAKLLDEAPKGGKRANAAAGPKL